MEHIIEINGKAYKQVSVFDTEYNQLWAEGSGRNYGDFEWVGTIAGNFDTVKVGILPENRLQLSTLIKDLRRGVFSVKYWSHESMGMVERSIYRANFTVKSIYISDTQTYTDTVALSFVNTKRE